LQQLLKQEERKADEKVTAVSLEGSFLPQREKLPLSRSFGDGACVLGTRHRHFLLSSEGEILQSIFLKIHESLWEMQPQLEMP